MIAFPRLKDPEDALAFCKNLVNEFSIMLLLSTAYDFDDQHMQAGLGVRIYQRNGLS
jgi:hypothetical protein